MCQIKECLMLPNLLVIAVVAAMASGLGKEANDRERAAPGTASSHKPALSSLFFICLLIKGALTNRSYLPRAMPQIQAAPAPQSSSPLNTSQTREVCYLHCREGN